MSKSETEIIPAEHLYRKVLDKMPSGKSFLTAFGIVAALLVLAAATMAITTPPERSAITSKSKLADYTNSDLAAYLEGKTPLNLSVWSDGSKVTVGYDAESSLDENDSVFRFARSAEIIIPTLFKIKGVESVYVQQSAQITDDYGNSKKEITLGIEILRATASKTDWAKINSPNRAGIIAIASDLYIHPSFEKKITGEEIKEAITTQRTKGANP